jgi:peptide deformylase
MRQIITDLSALAPAKPLEFITDKGIEKEEGESIIKDIKEAMASDEHILALSAPQLGIDKRIFCLKFNDVIKTFINPIITKKTGGTIAPETCCSMPGKEILISRPDEITVVYYTDEFKYEDNKLIGPAARLFDQQYQLLEGIAPSELGLVSDVEEDGSLADCTEEDIKQLTEIYKQFVQMKMDALKKEIEADEIAQKEYRTLKFTEDVINGRTQISETEEEAKARLKAEQAAQKSLRISMQIELQQQKAKNRANMIKMANKSRNHKGKRGK